MSDVALAMLWGLFISIIWLVIGWRAMKAHERIADVIENHFRVSDAPLRPQTSPAGAAIMTSESCARCGYTITAGVAKCPNCGGPRRGV